LESLKLAKSNERTSFICPPVEFLTIELARDLMEQLKAGNPSGLVRKIGSVFSTSSSLNASFLKVNIDTITDF
jgi:hypothetical protein